MVTKGASGSPANTDELRACPYPDRRLNQPNEPRLGANLPLHR